MLSKIKKSSDLEGMKESAYVVKLKSDLGNLLADKSGKPTTFLLHADYPFEGSEGTLLILGPSNEWKQYVKTQKWLSGSAAKKVWLGTCSGTNDTIELVAKKGKLTDSAFRKAMKDNSALKKFKWKVVESLEDGEDSNLLNDEIESTDSVPAANNAEDRKKAEMLDKQIKNLIKEWAGEADATKKNELLLDIDNLADLLYDIPQWEDYTDDATEKALVKIEEHLKAKVKKENEEEETEGTPAIDAVAMRDINTKIEAIKKLYADHEELAYYPQSQKRYNSLMQQVEVNVKAAREDMVQKLLAGAKVLFSKLNVEEEDDDEKLLNNKDLNTIVQKSDSLADFEKAIMEDYYEEVIINIPTDEEMASALEDLNSAHGVWSRLHKAKSSKINILIQDIKNLIKYNASREIYINEQLDAAKEIKKLLDSTTEDQDREALSELLEQISRNIERILN